MSVTTEFRVDQYELAYPDGIESHWWHLARNVIVWHEVQEYLTSKSIVLDVGCGRGIAVKSFRDRGIDCRGVELAETQPLDGLEPYIRYGIDASHLPYQERENVNVILLLDVIEHIPEPVSYLRDLVSAFPRLSHLILTVPARKELWSNYDEFYGHFHRYNMEMIQDLAKHIQWRTFRQSYFFRPLYPPLRFLDCLKINRNTKIKASNTMPKWMNKALSYLMITDRFLLPAAIPGSSLIACLCPSDIQR